MRRLLQLLAIGLIPGAAAGAAVGALFGYRYLPAGFPLLALDSVRRGTIIVGLGTALFLVLFVVIERMLARLPDRLHILRQHQLQQGVPCQIHQQRHRRAA